MPADGKLDPNGTYSSTGDVEIYVASDQNDKGISSTTHHEVTAHGEPAISGKPFGHTRKFNVDNIPRNDIDRKAVEAEKKAKENFRKP